ncbi:hypothetical protein ACHAWC_006035 [Mediolabrus comicus]
MPKSRGSSSTDLQKRKKRKLDKKKKKQHSSSREELSNVCNITGIGQDLSSGLGDELDCLDELAATTEQQSLVPTDGSSLVDSIKKDTTFTQAPPITLHEIPNIRVELARHLQVENLSTFLLQSCPNLRMPTFERWLIDSRLEQSDRIQSIAESWALDPASKLEFKSQKKKYGRAALHAEENAYEGRETARRIKESRILLEVERSMAQSGGNTGNIDRLLMKTRLLMDPILPSNPLETDPSSERLIGEIIANNLKMNDDSSDEITLKQTAKQVVNDLLNRCSDAVKEVEQLQNRFGIYQQFRFDKKRNKKSGSSSSGLVRVEWLNDSVCSLSYITTKKKSTTSGNDEEAKHNKTKPFVVKINGSHYHKLRRLFDRTSACADSSFTKEQITHAFHAAIFTLIIRYSTLAGGQQLNDLRGGGMQGAIHDSVFQCFEKWFGKSQETGTECFASPFNACLTTQFCSAFPSPDVDGFFGSKGDFFQLEANSLQEGWYELNPPFSPGIMKKMADRLMDLLNYAREKEIDVTFIVVVPSCRISESDKPDCKKTSKDERKKKRQKSTPTNALSFAVHHAALSSFRLLTKQCSSHIVLSKREHGYVEGSQHLRPTQFKESQYDTSVIVLRSKTDTNFDADAFESDLREAFKSRHMVELQQRRDCK